MRLLLPVAAVLSALALPVVAVLLHSYDYQHGWVSAHFATMARSFMENGIFALGGVPVRINDPQCVAKTFPDYFELFQAIVNLGIVLLVRAF